MPTLLTVCFALEIFFYAIEAELWAHMLVAAVFVLVWMLSSLVEQFGGEALKGCEARGKEREVKGRESESTGEEQTGRLAGSMDRSAEERLPRPSHLRPFLSRRACPVSETSLALPALSHPHSSTTTARPPPRRRHTCPPPVRTIKGTTGKQHHHHQTSSLAGASVTATATRHIGVCIVQLSIVTVASYRTPHSLTYPPTNPPSRSLAPVTKLTAVHLTAISSLACPPACLVSTSLLSSSALTSTSPSLPSLPPQRPIPHLGIVIRASRRALSLFRCSHPPAPKRKLIPTSPKSRLTASSSTQLIMAEITTNDQTNSPTAPDDLENGNGALENRGVKRPRPSAPDDDDDDDDKPGRERRKIEIKFIQDKSRRHITFSKRKAGIMKKAYELSVLTGTQVLLLVVSETGLVYTFTTPKLQPLVTKPEGKNLIQACLNAPEPADANGVEGESAVDSPEEQHNAAPQMAQPMAQGMPRNPPQQSYSMTADQQQALQYQAYLQQQQVAQQGAYPMPPQQGMQQQR
ncbi:hypothetical protein Q7P37_011301 [Cladosporium fusiforme]